jgi:hypothetical protein
METANNGRMDADALITTNAWKILTFENYFGHLKTDCLALQSTEY